MQNTLGLYNEVSGRETERETETEKGSPQSSAYIGVKDRVPRVLLVYSVGKFKT